MSTPAKAAVAAPNLAPPFFAAPALNPAPAILTLKPVPAASVAVDPAPVAVTVDPAPPAVMTGSVPPTVPVDLRKEHLGLLRSKLNLDYAPHQSFRGSRRLKVLARAPPPPPPAYLLLNLGHPFRAGGATGCSIGRASRQM
ncbi:hypothetical protein AMAG_19383 [Allomyces macrogynus ATCC 38327]|uniref:Uncharacterized protein n=1 Tax=Allomyces macrogynus (strain ATCC 38327) TaxID=578462 RepID=A0A0L0SUP3_ALLM3|nr:hypothetical protein AMAG_19383 [Allomyces macrogynus ATCC 38327]|eukprot:KNE66308.1 hypothetical protein AMAG_19383 [Allomyces macrogynus ATCC 38327]